MFNSGGFNNLPFNRSLINDGFYIFATGIAEAHSKFNAAYISYAYGTGNGSVSTGVIKAVYGKTISEGAGYIDTASIKAVYGRLIAEGVSEVSIKAIARWVNNIGAIGKGYVNSNPEAYSTFLYDGRIGPNDVLEIDTENYIVKINNVSVLNGYTGDFFLLSAKENKIIYNDTANSRTIEMTVNFEEKYL